MNGVELNADFEEAKKHLLNIDQNPDAKFTFQTFDDCSSTKKKELSKIFHGTLLEHFKILEQFNKKGAGVFVVVNETDLKGRGNKNVKKIRANFADKDDGPFLPLHPPATFLVQSKSGQHAYFCLADSPPLETFKGQQKAIAKKLQTDTSVNDLARVMRLAGFYHLKDPTDPFLVKIVQSSNVSQRYNSTELATFFPFTTGESEQKNKKRNSKKTIVKPSSENKELILKKFKQFCRNMPTEEGASNRYGGRNNTLLLILREGLANDLDKQEIERLSKEYCQRSGYSAEEIPDMLKRQIERHETEKFQPFFVGFSKEKMLPFEVAKTYLDARLYVNENGQKKFRTFGNDFYLYYGRNYEKVPIYEVEADVLSFVSSIPKLQVHTKRNAVTDIIANLKSQTLLKVSNQPPFFVDGRKKTGIIAVKNGLLDINEFELKTEKELFPHTSDYFNLNSLEFDYNPTAKCPRWLQFLNEMLPDPEVQACLQEWFGYNLASEMKLAKFVILVGDGANGKTVVCVVLRTLLGEKNVSAVGLEELNPQRKFPLAAMVGKLANIVEEIGEIDRTAEGVLKDIVGGGRITVEKKHKDSFETNMTAKLTFAANIMPQFRDKTSGIWRRLISIPFDKQLLDPAQQDSNLIDPKFWIESGEMSGILNWALEGLLRLRANKYFNEPKICADLKANFKEEANSAIEFLRDNLEVSPESELSSNKVYQKYEAHMEQAGERPLSKVLLNKEIVRYFKSVKQSQNARKDENDERCRFWKGLGFKND